MKKFGTLFLTSALVLALAGCGADADVAESTTPVESSVEESTEEVVESTEEVAESTEEVEESTEESTEVVEDTADVMSYADYVAAELDTEVTVVTYVQAKQSWWDNKATVYTQNEDGAFFLYNMACSEEDYEKLVPGTQIKVNGFKSEWAGEVEITDATFEIMDGNFVATAKDVTADLANEEELIKSQNQFVTFKGMTVEAAGQDADGNDVAFLYNWDGSGEEGNDLYFKVSVDGNTYSFTVESYLCGPETDVYQAVKALEIGQTVDMEGFLYWYEGVNPHITAVSVQ